jgi:hypothetical protein
MARKAKKEAYVVFHGRKPGLYYTWEGCQKQVHGFSGQSIMGTQIGSRLRWLGMNTNSLTVGRQRLAYLQQASRTLICKMFLMRILFLRMVSERPMGLSYREGEERHVNLFWLAVMTTEAQEEEV